MGRLVYTMLASLDGYIEDEAGGFAWAEPDEEVHAFVNDLARSQSMFLLGRRMYETLAPWETMGTGADEPEVIRDFAAIWRGADKVVYSTSLAEPWTARTRIERAFDPEGVRGLKEATGGDLLVGGPRLAAHAFAAGLVDECGLILHPVSVGGGKPALPRGVRIDLDLIDERRFSGGVVYLGYRVT